MPSNRAWAGVAGEEELQRSVLHVSPSIRPAAGVAEARAHPAQRIGVELAANSLLWHRQHGQPVVIAGTTVFTEYHCWLRASQRAHCLLTTKVG